MSIHDTNRDILITGLPRSGTTLLVALLNAQPDTVALAEPFPVHTFPTDEPGFLQALRDHIKKARQDIIQHGHAPSKVDRLHSTNFFGTAPDKDSGLRHKLLAQGRVRLDRSPTPRHKLYIKHPAAFTAKCPLLVRHYSLYACIRDPLAVLASWQTVSLPVNEGRLPQAERQSSELRDCLKSTGDTLSRQVIIIRWCLELYRQNLGNNIIRYEDIQTDETAVLRRFSSDAIPSGLVDKAIPIAERYPTVDLERLSRALERIGDLIRWFYPDTAAPWSVRR